MIFFRKIKFKNTFNLTFVVVIFCLFFIASGALAASLSFSPASGNYTVGQDFSLNVILNTQSVSTDGVDLNHLHYDKDKLELLSTNVGSLYTFTLVNSIDNITGTYSFSQASLGGAHYNGSGTLLTLNFRANVAGTAVATFDFTSGSTVDCNVAATESDVLDSVVNGSYIFTTEESVVPDVPDNGGGNNGGGGGGGYYNPPAVSAPPATSTSLDNASRQNLINQISNLMAQVKILQQRLYQAQGGSLSAIPVGYSFTRDLKYGDTGVDVTYLQIFLMSQGLDIYPVSYTTGSFRSLTFNAVIKFQQKYSQDILAPLNKVNPTGKVGLFTRNKINQILGR